MKKFYKVVRIHKDRMFSSYESPKAADRIINKQKKPRCSGTVEYKLNGWTYKPRIGPKEYGRKLFVTDDLHWARGLKFYQCEIYECEVKNAKRLYFSSYLVDAVKLTKQIK